MGEVRGEGSGELARQRSLLVHVTLDVPGRLPPRSTLRVELGDVTDAGLPVRTLARSELFVSRGDRLQIQLDVPEQALEGVERMSLSARVERSSGQLVAITMVPLLFRRPELDGRLELWVTALPVYERNPVFDRWLVDPDQLRAVPGSPEGAPARGVPEEAAPGRPLKR